MARTARTHSDSGVYHAILRGVNKQQIFECTEDYQRFLNILRTLTVREQDESGHRSKPNCVVYAYCLMGNHVHLLIKESSETLAQIMKRISSSYVYYYNHKYGRIGHLFQERFKSQPVGDWDYFLTLLRYIHQNPLKPHLVTSLREYKWSSWLEYIGQEKNAFCAINVVLSRISLEELSNLIAEPLAEKEEEGLLDIEETPVKTCYSDEEIWHVLTNLCGMTTAAEFQQLPRPQQKHYLWEAHAKGIGPRALSRLTGVPYSIVQRATSAENEKRLLSGMVCESTLEDEDWYSYCSPDEFEPYPEY